MDDEEKRGAEKSSDEFLTSRSILREALPEMTELVEDLWPSMLEDAAARRMEGVPAAWKSIVSGFVRRVHEADAPTHPNEDPLEQRRAREWSYCIMAVGDMMRFLLRELHGDLNFGADESLLGALLLERAVDALQVELRDGSGRAAWESGGENAIRMHRALRALTPRFDDINLRRLRALAIAEFGSRIAVPVRKERTSKQQEQGLEAKRGRLVPDCSALPENLESDHPTLAGVSIKAMLADVDVRFEELDPLLVFEEFAGARPKSRGGRAKDGEGKSGPVRALARLSIDCAGLGYKLEEGELFDDAVERVKANLICARSRIRKEFERHSSRPDE